MTNKRNYGCDFCTPDNGDPPWVPVVGVCPKCKGKPKSHIMTEQEWLTSTNPVEMLKYLHSGRVDESAGANYPLKPCPIQVSDRKLRLFACACVRQVWDRLTDSWPCDRCTGVGKQTVWGQYDLKIKKTKSRDCPDCLGTGRINRSRRAVEVAERYADGEATGEELRDADFGADYADFAHGGPYAQPFWAAQCCTMMEAVDVTRAILDSKINQPEVQAALLREIIGNPFRPVDREVLVDRYRWQLNVVPIAHGIYADRRFEELPILADALEEAGCTEEILLRHLQEQETCWRCFGTKRIVDAEKTTAVFRPMDYEQSQMTLEAIRAGMICTKSCDCNDGWRSLRCSHVRGCWALDLILGKE